MVTQRQKDKQARTDEKRKRSVCVGIKNRVDRAVLGELLPPIHSDIERIHFPRQKRPKFVFVVCKTPESVPAVSEAISKFKNDDTGPLYVKKQRAPVDKSQGTTTGSSKNFASGPGPVSTSSTTRSAIDPTKLVIDSLPEQVTEQMVYEAVPKCSKITMFKTALRPLLLEFKKPDDAYRAFEIISKTPIHGLKLNVKYHRIVQKGT